MDDKFGTHNQRTASMITSGGKPKPASTTTHQPSLPQPPSVDATVPRGDQSGIELLPRCSSVPTRTDVATPNRPLLQVARSVVTDACDIGGVGDAVELATVAPEVGAPSQMLGDLTGACGREMAADHGLTVPHVGVRKYADNIKI